MQPPIGSLTLINKFEYFRCHVLIAHFLVNEFNIMEGIVARDSITIYVQSFKEAIKYPSRSVDEKLFEEYNPYIMESKGKIESIEL